MNSNDVVIEVGARVGGGTLLLSRLVKQIYSFEPNSDSCRLLRNNTKNAKNVQIFNVALGEKEDEAILNVTKYMKYSHIGTLKKIKGVDYVAKEKVRIKKMDDFAFPLAPTAMIIDCEGYEEEVLKGAQEYLKKVKTVLVETHALPNGQSSQGVVRSLLNDFETKYTDGWVIATRK